MRKKIKFIFIQLLIILVVVEVMLRISGVFKTYSEKIGNGYTSYYGQVIPTWYHRWTPLTRHCFNQAEFNYCYQYNELGLRDREWKYKKQDSVKRIIILGDSFTEGDGAPDGENFPSYLGQTLNADSTKWEVYNGGVCGNDPFFNFQFFNTLVVPKYEYDVLMLLVNNSDISDYAYRGGMERFYSDSTTHYRKAPWFEPLNHYSHMFRAILKYGKFVSEAAENEHKKNAVPEMATLYRQINETIAKTNKKVVVVIHTFPGTVNRNETATDPIQGLQPLLEQNNIPYINICEAMKNEFAGLDYDKYAWKVNGHFNSFGYRVFSGIIYKETTKKYPDFFN